MPALPFLLLAVSTSASLEPVLWLDLTGAIRVKGKEITARVRPGTSAVSVPRGTAWELKGSLSGFVFPDAPQFAITGSLTISAWLRPSVYTDGRAGAQVVFRGDDRNSLDPYTLVIHPDGKIYFSVMNERGEGTNIGTSIPLQAWTHVVASLDHRSGELSLWKNGQIEGVVRTDVRPFANLDSAASPGVGIGNVQWDKSVHNQPFTGQLADLRIYDRVMTPLRIGLDRAGWNMPFHERIERQQNPT